MVTAATGEPLIRISRSPRPRPDRARSARRQPEHLDGCGRVRRHRERVVVAHAPECIRASRHAFVTVPSYGAAAGNTIALGRSRANLLPGEANWAEPTAAVLRRREGPDRRVGRPRSTRSPGSSPRAGSSTEPRQPRHRRPRTVSPGPRGGRGGVLSLCRELTATWSSLVRRRRSWSGSRTIAAVASRCSDRRGAARIEGSRPLRRT